MSKKRTKQLQSVVDLANKQLKAQKINFDRKYESEIFMFVDRILSTTGCYQGFNEYYTKTLEDGTEIDVLVGTENIPTEKRFVQFY